MPQAEIDPPAQSHAPYEASALPPSHYGWICLPVKSFELQVRTGSGMAKRYGKPKPIP